MQDTDYRDVDTEEELLFSGGRIPGTGLVFAALVAILIASVGGLVWMLL